MGHVAKGKVRSYDEERGFGFIRSPEAPDDVFFHFKDVVGGEEGDFEGATVEFTLTDGERGPKASNVRVESRRSGGAPAAERRPASANRPPSLREFRREVTEILLSVDGIGSTQIRAVRDYLSDYGLDRGFVVEDTRR
ncbi:cold shock domain-containing protein [Kineococcus aurantiacus]|uniref:Cold shock CspA family protein n=1 Tax=Kineococcus aurantiacus TaxID=37633 RepID=A0A7Y9DKK7_9ACTN|nr:cold shock CspA family protein [Kineococcus aurantiacus]